MLALAANTAFQGFPRLAALLASDSFLPRQFSNLGDRLVYSNGILVLALAAGALIVGFHADVDSLIHLYLLGVFTAFTLSQFGMVKHHWRRRDSGRSRASLSYKIGLNATGGLLTGLVGAIVITTKFGEGAWMVVIAIPRARARLRGRWDATTPTCARACAIRAATTRSCVARSCSSSVRSTTPRRRRCVTFARLRATASRRSTSPMPAA